MERKLKMLRLTQKEYIQKVLTRFNMEKEKAIRIPISLHIQLSEKSSLNSDEDKAYMEKIPYANAVESLIYTIVCMRSDIAYAIGLVSRQMSNPEKSHWEAVKYILRYLKGTTDY